MPYPNEHACRINDPSKYDKIRRVNGDREHNGKKYDVLYGIKGGKSEDQAYRYPKGTWSASEARSHCGSHNGSFEAAGESSCIECGLVEKRFTDFTESRVIEDDDGRKHITGHVTVFRQLSVPIFHFTEKIRPGAFTKSLNNKAIVRKSYFNHDPNIVLGNEENGTAQFIEDDKGILLDAIPPNTRSAQDVVILVRDGYVNHASFAFKATQDKWTGDAENPVREIIEGEFFEGGPVSDAAYPQTDMNIRALYRSMGLDIERMKTGVAKAHLGIDLTMEERDLFKSTMDVLANALASNDSGEEMGDNCIDYRIELEHLKLRLQLLELGI